MLKLTEDQENAKSKLNQFYASGDNVITLNGSAGSGKTTVIKQLLEEANRYQDTLKLINPNYIKKDILLAATTNKAVSVLSGAVNNINYEVKTIHSIMELRANNSFKMTNKGYNNLKHTLKNTILIIDEVSMLTDEHLDTLKQVTNLVNGKLILIGDSNQLAPVKQSDISKAFKENTIRLTQVVRQSSALFKTVDALRNFVETDTFPALDIDGINCIHLPQDEFEEMIKQDMSSNHWVNTDSRVLAYKNDQVKHYNDLIKTYITGTPKIVPGETVINSHYVPTNGSRSIPTEANVFVTDKKAFALPLDNGEFISGHLYDVIYNNVTHTLWMAVDAEAKATLKKNRYNVDRAHSNLLADLRPEYASTIHKAQGSTFKRVYIDLNGIKDVARYNHSMFKRLLYVAASRASEQIIFTGDLV